jgi:uncharacterized membrane protein YphA (DoxX/SURF4 family)
MRHRILLEIIYFLFILLFAYAALIKLLDVAKFQSQIGQSTILTHHARFLSIAVPVVELLIVVSLAIPRVRIVGLYLSMITMTVFSGYVFYILNFDPNIPCSCGGILDSMGWTEHLIFNVAFLALSVTGIVLESKINQNKSHATDNQ